MGILHKTLCELEDEKSQLRKRLEFYNVRSSGRDRMVKRYYDLENEILCILRHVEAPDRRCAVENDEIPYRNSTRAVIGD